MTQEQFAVKPTGSQDLDIHRRAKSFLTFLLHPLSLARESVRRGQAHAGSRSPPPTDSL